MNTILWLFLILLFSCQNDDGVRESIDESEILYVMPEEGEEHEGTWLQWPHHYQYGIPFRNGLDNTWVAMTRALVSSENVHIIAYNQAEQERITSLLQAQNIPLTRIDFHLYETDDTWIRDNGPIYVRDRDGKLVIEDWGFNGWGNKTDDLTDAPIQFDRCNPFRNRPRSREDTCRFKCGDDQ